MSAVLLYCTYAVALETIFSVIDANTFILVPVTRGLSPSGPIMTGEKEPVLVAHATEKTNSL